ncbi:MAG: hypothetical protein OXD33_09450 [Rhodobacteraceae bacterium]|nr:hypothetical protein [Paracoccaceae bacterium]
MTICEHVNMSQRQKDSRPDYRAPLTQIDALYHVLEKLPLALKEMIPDRDERQITTNRLTDGITAGEAVQVINALDPNAETSPAIQECISACRPNLHRRRSDDDPHRGLIEGGCRTVVVDRLKKRQPWVS